MPGMHSTCMVPVAAHLISSRLASPRLVLHRGCSQAPSPLLSRRGRLENAGEVCFFFFFFFGKGIEVSRSSLRCGVVRNSS
ncbi:hypothetical protein BS50DRAFT_341666 [Corynespora cassiicola Philippines]|uniref:Uncharacterized protein n=1 Tax=Corynespora cassiicola Philippines TaxID=1448308 RepID=A0A2T2NVF1_CORCC|nr:hypothetical protein BS50DRAFT_341666 [Corynespora cassiicola Philippines]